MCFACLRFFLVSYSNNFATYKAEYSWWPRLYSKEFWCLRSFLVEHFSRDLRVLLLTKAQADHWRVHVTAAFSAVSMFLFGTFIPRIISQNVTLLYKQINKENGYYFEGYIYIYVHCSSKQSSQIVHASLHFRGMLRWGIGFFFNECEEFFWYYY